MLLKAWDQLPPEMQTEEVRHYYDILAKKKGSLLLKRIFDICAALLLLVVLSPVLLVISILIALDSPGGVLYRQVRVTSYGKEFRIHKFRTMVSNADQIGPQVSVRYDTRITKIGAKIRKYRLDEFPQLFDVLAGNMSFVGTRPEVPKYVKEYTDAMRATLLLPAGITSEASIRFKGEAKLLAKADNVDEMYVNEILPRKMKINLNSMEHFSFWKEIVTMFRTVFAVLGKDYKEEEKPLIALLTNNDDDIYCFRKELIEAFIEKGYEVLISCPYGEKFDLMKEIPYLYDNPEIDRRGTNVIKDGKLFFHYIKLFKKYKPAVVLTYTAKPNVYGSIAAHLLGIPVINNVTGFGSVLNQTGMMQKFIMALFRFAYRNSDCIMFQNATNMKLAEETGMVKGDHILIPGSGVNTQRYPLQNYPEGGNGSEGEKIVFNYIGRILHDKGVDDYIEAAKRIRAKYPQTEFNMLGFIEPTESHYEAKLKELEAEGIVYYRGSQKDIRLFVARAHATIHPSTYGEGMSNVLLESASSGRPLITTDNPGCQETVVDQETGFLYHGGDVDALCDTIEQFLAMQNEDRKNMGEAGRTYIEENFSREVVIDAYVKKIYEIRERKRV